MKKFTKVWLLFLVIVFACSEPQEKAMQLSPVSVSGEFLFEGPNTLQGKLEVNWDAFLAQEQISKDKLSKVYLSNATIDFSPDSLETEIESALLQVVSDELELVSIATKNPLPSAYPVSFDIAQDQDILPYLMDPTAMMIVDVNIASDIEALSGVVKCKMNVIYEK
jgi:hypothetical protein